VAVTVPVTAGTVAVYVSAAVDIDVVATVSAVDDSNAPTVA
jgi:hypothetical protein